MKKILYEEKTAINKINQLWEQARNLSFPMKASVTKRYFRCGRRKCHCAKGRRHQDFIVTRYYNGKTQTIKIRKGRELMALEWTKNWRKMKKILDKITSIQLRILRMKMPDDR